VCGRLSAKCAHTAKCNAQTTHAPAIRTNAALPAIAMALRAALLVLDSRDVCGMAISASPCRAKEGNARQWDICLNALNLCAINIPRAPPAFKKTGACGVASRVFQPAPDPVLTLVVSPILTNAPRTRVCMGKRILIPYGCAKPPAAVLRTLAPPITPAACRRPLSADRRFAQSCALGLCPRVE